MIKNDIIDAYVFLRENNHTISDQTLDFMKNAALKAFDETEEPDYKEIVNQLGWKLHNTGKITSQDWKDIVLDDK